MSHAAAAAANILLVRKFERFTPLTPPERVALAALPLRVTDYSRGQLIAGQGETTSESAFVLDGLALRFKLLPDGLRQIVAMQVPGDFVDLQSFVLKPLDHAIGAAAPVKLARVSHAALAALIEKHPRFARTLMWDIALDAAISREWLATLGRRFAAQRLGHLFCELYLRMEWAGKVQNGCFAMLLTQTDLGDACGLSTVHVNRSLQTLRKDKLITLENHMLCVPDIDALAEMSIFDPAYLYLPEQ